MPDVRRGLLAQIEIEIQQYLTETTQVSGGYDFSQSKLVRRISMFENRTYPTGKFDSKGNYKFWYDLITPRINAEIKNVDFDTKDILAYSNRKIDELPCVITNLKIKEWLRENGQAEEINSAIEEGAGWGNIVWKKIKGGYERVDLQNFYVINAAARTLKESPVIERHQLSSSDLRAKIGQWDNVEDVIERCKNSRRSSTQETQGQETTVPYYDIYERNGEVSVRDLKGARNEEASEGDEKKYVLAKVIAAAGENSTQSTSPKIEFILFADEITKMPYKEYHRGRYKKRWWREGLYELLFDIQVRGNQIGNQIAQGLEWASKTVFFSPDKLVVQNILSDLANGDIIKTTNLAQVPVRMQGLDQLIAEWNRLIQLANDIANSQEIVQGENLPSGTPFRLGALLNQNANKLFDFIREKLAIPFSEIFEEWIIPELVSDMRGEDVLRLVGESSVLSRLHEMIVQDWYIKNLIAIGPHTEEIAKTLKEKKMEELSKRPQILMKELKKVFEGFKPNVSVVITGENVSLDSDLQTLSTFIQLEQDPIRRQALIEVAMRKKGLDVGALPKSPPIVQQPAQRPQPRAAMVGAGESNEQ